MNKHLGLFIKGHKAAIRTLIDKDKTVETAFNPAVLARAAGRTDNDIAVRQATDPGNRLVLVKHHLAPPGSAGIGQGLR